MSGVDLSNSRAAKKLKAGHAALTRKFGLGNKFKTAMKNFKDAGKLFEAYGLDDKYAECLEGVALCQENTGNAHVAARTYQDAGQRYVHSNGSEKGSTLIGNLEKTTLMYDRAYHCLERASSIFGEMGRALQAGKVEKEIILAIQEEVTTLKKAIEQDEDYIDSVEKVKRKEKRKPEKESIEDMSGSETDSEEEEEEEEEYLRREEEIDIEEDKIEPEKKVDKDLDDINQRKKNIEIYEKRIRDRIKTVVKHGRRASRFFEGSANHANCNQVLEMAGDTCALCYGGEKAADFYESILDADWNTENAATGRRSTIQFIQTKIITKMLLAQLLSVNSDNLMEKLSDMKADIKRYVRGTRDFKNSDQHVLVHGLCVSFQNRDEKRFKQAVKRYSKTNRLKDFMLEILLMVKKTFKKNLLESEESML